MIQLVFIHIVSAILHLYLFLAVDAQREYCGCIKCNDIGAYNTCKHQCKYCYATFNNEMVIQNEKLHNPNSSLLVGELSDDVKVYPVKVTTGKKVVKTLFD